MPAVRPVIRTLADDQGFLDGRETAFHHLSLLLTTGGDERISPDPVTGRNRYGTKVEADQREISFASTTASNISSEGFLAAENRLAALVEFDRVASAGVDAWFADIRGRISRHIGASGSKVILAASGTDVELIALSLAAGLSTRPLTNILIAPEETGSGIPRAAAGLHFSDRTALGFAVKTGAVLNGIDDRCIEVRTVAIRNPLGQPRPGHEVDAEVVALVEQEIKRGRDVLVHVLDTSKTGLTAVSRQAARHVAALAPGRVRVLVDACQFRCSGAALRQDIADGFLVAVTGSKFYAGPPFSGALIVPASLEEEFATARIAGGLSDYTALYDWPPHLRDRTTLTFGSHFNLGLGLRWIAALTQIEPLAQVEESLQVRIKHAFTDLVRTRADHLDGASIHADDDGDHIAERAIVPLTIMTAAGSVASFAEAQQIHLALRDPAWGPVCHIGQAVRIGERTILRVAASASDLLAVSTRLAAGQSFERAMRPLTDDLDRVFGKWATILRLSRAK